MKIENKLFCISEVKGVNEEERSIEAWGSKPTMDRDNEIIATNAWNLKDFRKNPVVQSSICRDCSWRRGISIVQTKDHESFFCWVYPKSP